ncbi:hypothetical protein IB229_17035 [Pseudomonas sp. PDM14]|uniref:hypothetical protein n=1 Tax=Pseudomonas sp. PDM14 TaxID=2769288 RepID=UPI001782D6E9|nr:hypothetical protein [Pseudomonas sp. PDM14]MBD9484688.1 hypothetical protein [Pseudomonas sp. PDM14]
MSEARDNLERVQHSAIFRWAQLAQWFGLAALLVAVLLGFFSELTQTPRGITLIALLGMLGLLALVPARFILTLHLMKREQKP